MIIYTKKDSDADFHRFGKSRSELLQTLNLEGENLICIAGRPGMGKTALALHLALDYAKTNSKAVHIFSLEMSAEQMLDRLLIMLSEVDSYTFRQKSFSDEEKERLEQAKQQLSCMNIAIDDTISLSVKQMEEKIAKAGNLGLVIVDYVQLLMCEKKCETRMEELYEISRNIKTLSQNTKIPIIITSGVHRRVEYRENKRPIVWDLEHAGVLENEVDTICFIYRKGYYEPLENSERAEFIIQKNKHGVCGTVPLKWEGLLMKFSPET